MAKDLKVKPRTEKFRIGELFSSVSGNVDLQKKNINGKGLPVISSGRFKRGVIGKTDVEARAIPANTLTIDMFGNAYFRDFEYKEATHARVFSLIPKGFSLDRESGLYMEAALSYLSELFSYSRMCSYTKICDMGIDLPVVESEESSHVYKPEDIDWEYMREYIAELETERVAELEAELEAYLKATGLENYKLSDEDRDILALHKNGGHKTQRFRIEKLFFSVHGDVDLQQKDINGRGLPVISSGTSNFGIIGKTDIEAKIIPADTLTIDMFGNAYFRDFEYKEATHARVFSLIPKGFSLDREAGLYMEAVLSYLPELFSYSRMCSYAKICDMEISLPVAKIREPGHVYTAEDIDFTFMGKYIRAVEKQVIASAVMYKDRVIETAKALIQKKYKKN